VDAYSDSDTFDVTTMFRETEFLAEAAAVAEVLHLDARSTTTTLPAASAAAGDDVPADAPAAAVEVVAFPPGALTSFARGVVEATGALRPYAVVEPSLGVVFGTWSRGEAAGGGWCAAVGFLQPWEGQPSELVAWLNAEEAAAEEEAGSGRPPRASAMIRPIGGACTS
jgi:hypothetical protein